MSIKKTFKSMRTQIDHERTLNQHPCIICEKLFSTNADLLSHISSNHNVNNIPSINNSTQEVNENPATAVLEKQIFDHKDIHIKKEMKIETTQSPILNLNNYTDIKFPIDTSKLPVLGQFTVPIFSTNVTPNMWICKQCLKFNMAQNLFCVFCGCFKLDY
eukprot:484183_1